jgi:hypothetical protein
MRIGCFAIVARIVTQVSILFPEELHEKFDNAVRLNKHH